MSRLPHIACACVLALLAACAAPPTDAGSEPATSATRQAPATAASNTPPAGLRARTGGPLPPLQVPRAVSIDLSCRSDADCAVKDVGNCCGYYPACVNVGSPTNPAAVKAQCQEQGLSSSCGFQQITACSCHQGQCTASDPSATIQ